MKKWRVIHPLLFALFPVLFLFSHNVGRLPASATAIPSLVVLVLTLLLWGV